MARWNRRGGLGEPRPAAADPPAPPVSAQPSAPVPAPAAPVAAWRGLPPLQRVLGAAFPAPDTFGASLTSWQDPRFLAPLGHFVLPDGPSGEADGLSHTSDDPSDPPTGVLRTWPSRTPVAVAGDPPRPDEPARHSPREAPTSRSSPLRWALAAAIQRAESGASPPISSRPARSLEARPRPAPDTIREVGRTRGAGPETDVGSTPVRSATPGLHQAVGAPDAPGIGAESAAPVPDASTSWTEGGANAFGRTAAAAEGDSDPPSSSDVDLPASVTGAASSLGSAECSFDPEDAAVRPERDCAAAW